MVRPERRPRRRDRLAEQRLGLAIPAAIPVEGAEVVHGDRRIRMLCAEPGAQGRQRLPVQRLRHVETPSPLVADGQVVHA